jgi:guanine deaminase
MTSTTLIRERDYCEGDFSQMTRIKTLTGAKALLGEDARLSDGAVDIVIEGRTIREIRPAGAGQPEGEALPCDGLLLTPGLINGHHHSHEHFYKGRKDNLPLELWMNYVRPLRPIEYTPRQVYLRTMVGALESVRTGATTICDDLNVSPRIRRDYVEAAFQAYEDVGIRALVGITLFDRPFFRAVPYVDEEFPPALLAALDRTPMYTPDELLAFAAELARTRHPKQHRVGYIAAPSAPQRCTEAFLKAVRRMADDHDLPLMIHVQETRMQVVTGQLWYGMTMVEYLDSIGFMKPNTQFIHGVWLNPRELRLIAERGVTIQHNPTSNLKVGSGLIPLRAVLDAGINVSLGTDGCGSIENVDMQLVLTFAALLQKLRGDHTAWTGAAEAFRAGTVGGAKALGRSGELGAIAPGHLADITGYRLDSLAFTPANNLLNQLVYSASRADLALSIVDGEVVLRDGKFTRVDEAALIAEIAAAHAEIEPVIAASEAEVETLLGPYERIYRRCQHQPIAPDTFPARFPY